MRKVAKRSGHAIVRLLSSDAEKVSSRQTEMLKLWNHLEGSRGSIDDFSNLIHQCRRSVAQEFQALANVHNSAGFESHQPRTGCVGSDRIVRKHYRSKRPRRAVERPVSFHCHNAVRDDEVNRNGGAEIEDAFLNAVPVEDILRPSVSCARNYAEYIFHAESDAGPVVGLDLRHRNQEV